MEPILRWAGGKRQLIPTLEKYIDRSVLMGGRHRYYEPFFGGGALCFYLEPLRSVINDYNPELINVYEVIRDSPQELIDLLRIHQVDFNHDHYTQVRSMDRNPGYLNLPPVERAARIIFLNRTCYNGLYRVNNKGFFNVPIGRKENPDIIMEDKILTMNRFFNENEVVIRCGDFENCVEDAQSGDVIYFDPPYDYEDSGFTSYNENCFDRTDLKRLKAVSDKLIEMGCHVILSNNDTPFVNDLFEEYAIEHIDTKRFISCDGKKRNEGREVIIYGDHKLRT